jgi:hypothetical protein
MDLHESLCRYIGQTVTLFTESGGLSGSGFTGTLASVNNNIARIITSIGAAPTCPIGSGCGFGYNNDNNNYNCNCNSNDYNNNDCNNGFYGNNWLGSVTEIPICKIVSFTHNAV